MKKIIFTLFLSFLLTSNINASSKKELLLNKNQPSKVKDCFETLNRVTFTFNKTLDGLIIKPAAKVYKVLPSPIRNGVSNGLDNLSNLVTIPNNVIQGDFKKAGINSGRFIINTTVGILGLVDVANYVGFPGYEKEDYGQSLAYLGVGPGCYVVLPFIGPSTIRDSAASLINMAGGDAWYNVTVKNDTQYFNDFHYYSSVGASVINYRAKNYDGIENLEKNSIDFYASVKSLYLQDRQQKILNTNKIVDTQDDSNWEEIEN